MDGGKRVFRALDKRLAVLLGAGVAVVAAVVVVLVVHNHGSSSAGASAKTPLGAVIKQHLFLSPECTPIHGSRWVYPGPVKISSSQYESFAIAYPCKAAAAWTLRLARDTVPFSKTGRPVKVKGPAGFNCEAWSDANHHAYAGGCQKGKKVAFGWNWNVVNPHDYIIGTPGHLHVSKGEGSDAETILRTISAHRYELEVDNTSGIGFINRFNWTPPPGWTLTTITKATGAKCSLLSSGKISCSGIVQPPACLCAGGGGSVTIDFTISTQTRSKVKGHPFTTGTVGSKLTLTAMTPLPFLVPGTPAAAARQRAGE